MKYLPTKKAHYENERWVEKPPDNKEVIDKLNEVIKWINAYELACAGTPEEILRRVNTESDGEWGRNNDTPDFPAYIEAKIVRDKLGWRNFFKGVLIELRP